ncbi:retrovirus-related pol polyprotein from transposon TNT 1-94 [Tanacetum coccineum]
MKKDAKAMFFIQQAVDEMKFSRIAATNSAKEAWDTLKTKYQGSTKVITVKLQFLGREFESAIMKGNETVQEYLARISSIVSQMRADGDKVADEIVVANILRSLSLKFDHVVAAIEESKDLSKYSIDELMGSLQTHAARINKNVAKKMNTAFKFRGNMQGSHKIIEEEEVVLEEEIVDNACTVKKRTGEVLLKLTMTSNRMFPVDFSCADVYGMMNCKKESTEVWHQRYGHLYVKGLQLLSNKDMVEGLPVITKLYHICEGCALGKQSRRLFPVGKAKRSEERLEVVLVDICGLMITESHAGSKFCDEYGIKRELTTPYTPEQNDIAECKNQTIMEIARSMLKTKNFEDEFWAKAVATAIYLINISPKKVVWNVTPYEAWYELKPSVSHLRIFRCTCYAIIPLAQNKGIRQEQPTNTQNGQNSSNIPSGTSQPVINSSGSITSEGKSCAFSLFVTNPTNTESAINNEVWMSAMQEEIDVIERNGTWKLAYLPKGKKAISLKWIFKTKFNSDGTIQKHKARLVAHGYIQEHGIDFKETFSPMARFETAPRAWYNKIDDFFHENGFEISLNEPTLYVKRQGAQGIMLVSLYVDDMIYTGSLVQLISEFKEAMMKKFEMSNLGKLSYFLGLEVQQGADGIFLSQQKYANDILNQFSMVGCKIVGHPMNVSGKLTSHDGTGMADARKFRSLMGRLIYLTHTQPDLTYALGIVSRFMHCLCKQHFGAAKRILRYITGTTSYGIWYSRKEKFELVGYSDSDWAGEKEDMQSTSGNCFTLRSGIVYISRFNPFGLAKLTTFVVMCKAYGGEPNMELLVAFLNLGPVGDPLYRLIATYHVSVRTFPDPILYLASLKTSWEHGLREPAIYYHGKEMAFRSFMMDGIDGEFSFLPKETVDNEGAGSPSFSINTETPATCVEPLRTVDPSRFAENTADSDDFSSGNDDVLIDSSVTDRLRNWKVSVPSQVVEKRKHVVPKLSHRETRQKNAESSDSWKQSYRREKDKEYAELEAKCNDALQDLEKNPLILDFRGEIVTLQCQVERLHGEYSRIVLEEKKWVNYEQTLASLRSKVEGLEAERSRLEESKVQLLQQTVKELHDLS